MRFPVAAIFCLCLFRAAPFFGKQHNQQRNFIKQDQRDTQHQLGNNIGRRQNGGQYKGAHNHIAAQAFQLLSADQTSPVEQTSER